MTKTRRQFTREFKEQAVARMDSPDCSNEQLAKELELDISLLYKWRRSLRDKGNLPFLARETLTLKTMNLLVFAEKTQLSGGSAIF